MSTRKFIKKLTASLLFIAVVMSFGVQSAFAESNSPKATVKIVERGTHDELLAKEGKYYELWNMQQGIYRRREPVAKQPVAAAVVEDDDDGEAFTY